MNNIFGAPEVRVVEASAGSGKTYALAKRYIQLLLVTSRHSPLSLKHILAITFTNKAAGEMKARIIDYLKKIALGQLSQVQADDILRPLGLSQETARPLAQGLMEELIHHYHYFGVQTIDAFMNTLLAGCAFKINLSARFKIKRNAIDYLQLSLDQLIDESGGCRDTKLLFDRFIRQYLFLENRSGWFPKKDLLSVLVVLFNQYNTYQKPLLTFGYEDIDVFASKKDFLELIKQLRVLLPKETDKRFVDGLDKFIEEHPVSFDIDNVSRYFSRETVPVKTGAPVPSGLGEVWQKCTETLRDICLQESYAVFNPYVRLFTAAMNHFDDLQTKDDVLFLQQLNKKTGDLFDDGLVTVEELYYRLATRYHHYLMDEFQDTSMPQWHNLNLMVEEALSTGGTLFYVGDKKQAIYSFRGGQSQLFNQLQAEFASFNIVKETLERNYRSHRQIVEFNNYIFSLENIERFIHTLEGEERFKDKDIVFDAGDMLKIDTVFGSAKQISRDDLPYGAVRVQIISGRRKEDRFKLIREKTMAALKDALTRFSKRDIAILTRNNAEVQMVTEWLVQVSIAAQSERTSDIKAHPLIGEIRCLLGFLNSPVDNIAFVQFLSGDLFPKASGLSQQAIQDFLFSSRFVKSVQGEVYFYKLFKEAYPEIWQKYFEEFLNKAGVYPLYELAVSICGVLQCVQLFPEAQSFVMHFLELIKRKEEDRCDLETFLTYFDDFEDENRFVPSPNQDAVRVLTVHKSKGLEFGAVIIPFLEMSIKVGSSDRDGVFSFTWDMEEGEGDNQGMRLVRIKESYTQFSAELKKRYIYEYKQAFLSELNSVYVALTRAVLEMHILIPERVGNSINPLPHFIPVEYFQCGEFHKPVRFEHIPAKCHILPVIEHHAWVGNLQEEFLGESSAQQSARRQGEIIHFCLARLGDLSSANVTKVIAEAVAITQRKYGKGIDAQVLIGQISHLIEKPSWRSYFYLSEGVEVKCEQEIVNRFGDTKRLDRVIVNKNEVVVIDFKTSRIDEAAHAKQLDEYVNLIKPLYHKYAVKGALLYLDDPR